MQKKYFGTDGVRGRVAGEVINPQTITQLGWAIGCVLMENAESKPTVLIGRDTRESGLELQTALQNGLLSAGVSVSILGVLSTPAIAYLTENLSADAGVVISASHNPYHDNGVKIIGKKGVKFSDEWEMRVEKKMQEKLDATCAPEGINRVSTPSHDHVSEIIHNASEKYIFHCLKLFETLNLKNQKIILDCANGATFNCAPAIFSKLGASVITIHAEPNGKNINAHCGATDVADLQARVIAEKADCGIAFDGDGDRLIMVDHLGEVIDGDEILAILATDPSKKYVGIVGTLMSNLGLEIAIQSRGMQFERASVGDRYVLEKLKKNHWRLGGEGSGHIINLDYASTGDGVLTALQILQIMQQTKKSLHDAKQVMQKRPQVLINVPVKNPNRFSGMPEITEAVKNAEKKLNGAGRILLRASGTESCVRVMVEANDETQARELAQSLAEVVRINL